MNDVELLNVYRQHFRAHAHLPLEPTAFYEKNQVNGATSISDFTSFDDLNIILWKEYIEKAIEICYNDETYHEYSVREKAFALFFTFIEQINKEREFNIAILNKYAGITLYPKIFREFKKIYEEWVKDILDQGLQTGEVLSRPFLTKYYDEALWLSIVYIVRFWRKDISDNQEQTDLAIDKVVNLLFDMLMPNAADSAFDMLNFLIKDMRSNE